MHPYECIQKQIDWVLGGVTLGKSQLLVLMNLLMHNALC